MKKNKSFRKVSPVLTELFYKTMVEWCKGHNFDVISPSILPKYTFVIEDVREIKENTWEHTPLYSICFYNTDSNLAWVGWELSNPTVSRELKKGALKELFLEIERYAKNLNYQLIFTTSNTKPVEDVMLSLNYNLGDEGVNHYIKSI